MSAWRRSTSSTKRLTERLWLSLSAMAVMVVTVAVAAITAAAAMDATVATVAVAAAAAAGGGRLWHLVGRLRGHRVQMGLLKKPAAFASPQ